MSAKHPKNSEFDAQKCPRDTTSIAICERSCSHLSMLRLFVGFRNLGVRCLSCRHSRCIHSRNVRAAIKSNCMGRLISRLPMTLPKKDEHAAEARADTSLLPCKVPIARRRFVLPGSSQIDETRQQAVLERNRHGLLASIGLHP
jgi:hypothetical protein